MNKRAIWTYYKEADEYAYDILEGLAINIKIKSNPYDLPLESLFLMAARINEKRNFLFVSKILGKHIPVKPFMAIIGGRILAHRLMEALDRETKLNITKLKQAFITEQLDGVLELLEERINLDKLTTFIGFAETATGLGHIIFDSFKNNAFFIHTTRDELCNLEKIEFLEEHSHSIEHKLYCSRNEYLEESEKIVFIDDEITTGKTILNFIEEIHKLYPKKEYVVLTLLDWRTQNHIEKFIELEKNLSISIRVVSILSGNVDISGELKGNLSEHINNKEKDSALSASNMLSTGTILLNDESITSGIGHKKELYDHVQYTRDTKFEKPNVNTIYLSDYFDKTIEVRSLENNKQISKNMLIETGKFGLKSSEQDELIVKAGDISKILKNRRKGEKTLCLGSEEFIYIPLLISSKMGDGIYFHSTTISPIFAYDKDGYGIKNAFLFNKPEDENVVNRLYNIEYNYYDEVFLFLEREVDEEKLSSILSVIESFGVKEINIVFCLGVIKEAFSGSYSPKDVTFLLKNLNNVKLEVPTGKREELIQSGIHYSEMLPVEYKPSQEYMELFLKTLKRDKSQIALLTAIVSEKILYNKGRELVLVSLARAGTPIGVLIKKYFEYKYNLNIKHYSISIIRGKGIDKNAMRYILRHHPSKKLQFIDGWTGKGAISKNLNESSIELMNELGIPFDFSLAVLSDPGHCAKFFGTRGDLIIPSSCLNSTVSGLVSRTVHRKDLIGEGDFHGVKFYEELMNDDLSNFFINEVTSEFPKIEDLLKKEIREKGLESSNELSWKGLKDIESIQKKYNIKDINLIKPGIGETTRVLLRRVPWMILVNNKHINSLEHILMLAKDKNVEVEEYKDMAYECCGIIKPV